MLILHAFWSPDATADFIQYGDFHLWAETLTVARTERTQDKIPRHPFQLPAKDWPAFWGSLGFKEDPGVLALETQSLLLPSAAEAPLPSPTLARYWPTDLNLAEARPRPWRLDCLRLDRPIRQLSDIHFLAFQQGGAVQPAGDFLFWYWFTQEIKRLLVRDQYLPALVMRQPPRPKGGRKDPPLEILGGWEWAGEAYEQLIARAVERLPPAAVRPPLDDAKGPANGGDWPVGWPDAESHLRHCAEVLLDQIPRQLAWPAVFTKKVTGSLLAAAIAPRPTNAPWIGVDQVRHWRQWRGHLRGAEGEVAFTLGFQLEEPPLDEPGGVGAAPDVPASPAMVAEAAGIAGVAGATEVTRVPGAGGAPGSAKTFRTTGSAGDASAAGAVGAAVLTDIAADPGDGWTLHFVAIPRDDPSRRLPLADYWAAGPAERRDWRRHLGQDFETHLLLNLGLAARMVPKLWQGLATAAPQGLSLSLDEAFAFLKEWAWILEDAGYKIIIPAWWTPQGRRRVKIRLRTAPSQAKPSAVASGEGGLKLKNLVQYRYELAIGDEVVSPEEWRQLVESKAPLVRFRGQWVELDRDKMREMLAFWQRHGQETPTMSVQDLLQRTALDEDFEVDRDDALAGMLRRLRGGGHLESVADPPGLRAQLRDYQKRGVAWLCFLEQCGLGACLADDMGLGKTLQAIARLVQERAEGEGPGGYPTVEAEGRRAGDAQTKISDGDAMKSLAPAKSQAGAAQGTIRVQDAAGPLAPTLLIAPTSVIGNWHKEVQKFAPQLPVHIHHGPTRSQDKADFLAQTAGQALVITSYALARRDQALFTARDWHRVILDEAQNIKNPLAAQTKAILKLRAPHRLALTGTPVENRLIDLWSIFNFLNPGYLDTQARFRKGYEIPVQRDRDPVKTATLKRLVEPFILRRLKSDKAIIQDLPDKLEALQYCNLSKEQAALYESVVRDVERQLEDKEGIARQGLMLSTLMKLKQICNHPAQFLQDGSPFTPERSHKLQRLQEMLEEAMAEGDSVLIFSQFTEVAAALERRLRQELHYPTFYLHGGTPRAKREDMIAAFQDPEAEPAIFVLSLKAGGVGITLTKANHVFHFDRWWNPAVEDQASDRAFRIGQEKTVFVHKFVTLGTLEERISDMIEDKKAIAGAIVGNDESWLTQLDNERFKALIRLNRAAVVE